MPHKITHIHDTFIKDILSRKESAIDFFKEYLPEPLVKVIDFDTLTPLNTSYISRGLKTSYSDLVWSIRIFGKENLQISMLLEHKSYIDPAVAFQLLEYLASGYRKQLKEKKKPELIIPILYYHGKYDWEFKSLEDFFSDYPDFLKVYLPVFLTEFVNLHRFPAEQILELHNGLLSGAIMIQKYFFDPDSLNSHFRSILEKLLPYLYSNLIDSIFVYLEYSGLDEIKLDETIKNLPDDMSTRVMTLREQLILKGKEQGIAEAMAKLEQSVIQIILNAYDSGINPATIKTITGESEEKINLILRQNHRIR